MYIVNKRFKKKCICGEVNIPYGTPCELRGYIIYHNHRPLCYATSQDAYDYFSNNEDGQGLKRGELVHEIKRRLAKRDDKHQARWDKLWENEDRIGKFRQKEHGNHWLWGFKFYNAPIVDLEFILNIIKEVK